MRATQTLSYVSEGAIFLYVGMDTLDPLKWKVPPHRPPPPQPTLYVGMDTLDPLKWKVPLHRPPQPPPRRGTRTMGPSKYL